jgi:hypothetical protein
MPDITPISKKDSTRYFNWRRWISDWYVSAVRAGTGAFLAFSGTNTAEAVTPVSWAIKGMDWKQAACAALGAILFDTFRYINLKPLPEEVTAPPFENQNS